MFSCCSKTVLLTRFSDCFSRVIRKCASKSQFVFQKLTNYWISSKEIIRWKKSQIKRFKAIVLRGHCCYLILNILLQVLRCNVTTVTIPDCIHMSLKCNHCFEHVHFKGELRPEISLLHMKVLTLIKGKSNVFLWYVQCCSCTRRSKTKLLTTRAPPQRQTQSASDCVMLLESITWDSQTIFLAFTRDQ